MTEQKRIDNGGAEAIRGFNFQKANLILLAINNYMKPNFKIYVEAEDDIVVTFDDYKAIIQVKKQSHTFNSLTKKEKPKGLNKDGSKKNTEKLSILEKNLSAGEKDDVFKIFVKDIGKTDKKRLIVKKPGQICVNLHQLNDEAKTEILSKLPSEDKTKLDNFYLHISPLGEEYDDAQTYLIGTLNKNDISVDNNQGRAIIAELTLNIDHKSQHIIQDISDKELKYMDSEYFSNIFITSTAIIKFEKVLDTLQYGDIKSTRIKKERLKIDLTRVTLKEDIKGFIQSLDDVEDLSNLEIVKIVLEKYLDKDDQNLLIAIAIEAICEIGE
ncbi:DUF4297 domain-containing protein [Sporosarcina sp. BI001-red]|uniref:DUF4297 domain-containing protein n=1 Tax=Sporosarcina sp. BI001-red TaxID=2282866 RepID=UPI000E24DDA3|nr:DUF4297 domain-containing protein [Sporosarcina sp. BI001-red]REB10037.1 DUF4297 domain-containing protein [Sporosarcina sp. BI001-red]